MNSTDGNRINKIGPCHTLISMHRYISTLFEVEPFPIFVAKAFGLGCFKVIGESRREGGWNTVGKTDEMKGKKRIKDLQGRRDTRYCNYEGRTRRKQMIIEDI